MRISKSELQYLRSLSQKKVRDVEKMFIVEGWRSFKDALESGAPIEFVGIQGDYLRDSDYSAIVSEIERRRIPLKELSNVELRQVSDTVNSQGIVAVLGQFKHELNDSLFKQSSTVVGLDGIGDPGNLGSIIRTCDWFGVDAVLLGEGSVHLYNEKVVRSTAGSLFHLPVIEGVKLPEVLDEFKRHGFTTVATTGDGKTKLQGFQPMEKTFLLFGSEPRGISKEMRARCDEEISIPKLGRAESLNVGVACGIFLSHLNLSGRRGSGVGSPAPKPHA